MSHLRRHAVDTDADPHGPGEGVQRTGDDGLTPKIILDLCGGTGAWSRPYREAGYDVRLVTLPEHDVRTYEPPEGVYGILAAPPCTEFSLAKGSRPRNLAGAMEVVEACLRIIWRCRLAGRLKFWALENPLGLMRQFLGRPAMTFYQWQFNDDGIKPTDLWGYFKPPVPTVIERPPDMTKRYDCGRTHAKNWDRCPAAQEYAHLGLTRAERRAITPPGFAQAFYRANR